MIGPNQTYLNVQHRAYARDQTRDESVTHDRDHTSDRLSSLNQQQHSNKQIKRVDPSKLALPSTRLHTHTQKRYSASFQVMPGAGKSLQNNVTSLSCIKVVVLFQSPNRRDLGCPERHSIYRVSPRSRHQVVRTSTY
jgi:hypothetical protein